MRRWGKEDKEKGREKEENKGKKQNEKKDGEGWRLENMEKGGRRE